MNTELRNSHKIDLHQSILEHCADLLDEDNILFYQQRLGISDPVEREKSELHIRMADAAYLEYEKTMFPDDTIQSCGLLPSELLKQRDEMREMLKKISVVLEEIWMAEDGDNIIFDKINAEELDNLIKSTNP